MSSSVVIIAPEGGDVFGETKGVVGVTTQRTDPLVFIPSAGRLSAILDDRNVVFFGDGIDGIHVTRCSKQVVGTTARVRR